MPAPCPTCIPLDCDLTEDQNLYSIESPLFPFVLNCPPGFDCHASDTFKMLCCGQLLQVDFPPSATVDDKNTLRQELVNQCGVRQLYCNDGDLPQNPPDNPVQLYLNVAKTCTVFCPDGNPFVFIVFAGEFAASTQSEADRQASAYACQQAALRKICLNQIPQCLCVGTAFSSTIPHTGGIPPFIWSVHSGILPIGLSLNQSGVISGTPTANGIYSFTIQVTASDGSYMRKPYSISALEITDTTLPDYTVGAAYSHQLAMAGGSGNYAVKVDAGAFPDGITMSISGLISGTPTGLNAGTMPMTFTMVDTSCQATDQSFFPPAITLLTRSTTRIATVLGYPEYIPSVPPKRYKTLTWSGTSEQVATTINTGDKVGDAKYVYSGAGVIGLNGNQISNYAKDYSTPCPSSSFEPAIVILNVVPTLKGYCWPADPNTCPVCEDPPVFKANVSTDMIHDEPYGLVGVGNLFHALTPTSLTNIGSQSVLAVLADSGPGGTTGVPHTTFSGVTGAWVQITGNHNYQSALTDEYTDAEALSVARVIVSNGKTAENLPRTTGFVSRYTGVAYRLNMTNLIEGQSYLVTVTFRDSNFLQTQKQYGVIASATTAVINDTIATPPDGVTKTISQSQSLLYHDMGCSKQLSLNVAQTGIMSLDQAVYEPISGKIFGVSGQWVFQFNSVTGALENSLRFQTDLTGPSTIAAVGGFLYIGTSSQPIIDWSLGNTCPDVDIYKVSSGLIPAGRLNLFANIAPSASSVYYGWRTIAAGGDGLIGVFMSGAGPKLFNVFANGTTFTSVAHQGVTDIAWDNPNAVIWIPSSFDPDIFCYDPDFSSLNTCFDTNGTLSTICGICYNQATDSVYAVDGSVQFYYFAASSAVPLFTNFFVSTGAANLPFGSNPYRIKSVNGMPGNPYNGKILVPCWANDTVQIIDPALPNGGTVTNQSGFTAPFDIVVCATKNFAVQSGSVGLKEIL